MFLFAIQVEEAVEHAAEHGGSGNMLLDLFQNNLLNWVLLVAALVYLAMKFLPGIFQARQDAIEAAIKSAEMQREEGRAFLADQRAKVANVDEEAERILVDAKNLAEQMKAQMDEQTTKDVETLLQKIESSIANERQLLITELRTAAVKAAVLVTEEHLRQTISETQKNNLVTQFIAQLDTVSKNEQAFSAGQLESAQHSGGRS